MTRDEFKVMVKALKAVYTQPSFIPDKGAFEIWYGLLKDLDYETATYAVKKYMQTEEREPSVASIRKHAMSFREAQNDEFNEISAWQLVLKAIRNSAYHADEEFAKLPPVVQRAVANPGQLHEWAIMENVDGNTMSVMQSHFMRTYRAELAMEKEKQKLSPDVLKLMSTPEKQILIRQEETTSLTVSEERTLVELDAVPMPERLKTKYVELMSWLG